MANVGEGPAVRKYKAMLAAERAAKAKKSAKPKAKPAAKPTTIRGSLAARKKLLDSI